MATSYAPTAARLRARKTADRVAETALRFESVVADMPTDMRRKNMRIDQIKLRKVMELLGVATETEAVDQALDLLLFRRELSDGIQRLAGTGIVRDIWAEDEHRKAGRKHRA